MKLRIAFDWTSVCLFYASVIAALYVFVYLLLFPLRAYLF